MEETDSELHQIFFEEVAGHIGEFEKIIIEHEQGNWGPEQTDELFRIAHNLKGSSRSVGFEGLAQVAHGLEDILSKLKKNKNTPSKSVANILLKGIDAINKMVSSLQSDNNFVYDTKEILAHIAHYIAHKEESAAIEVTQAAAIPDQKDTGVVRKISAATKTVKPQSTVNEFLRVSTSKLDSLINLIGEIVVNQSFMNELKSNTVSLSEEAKKVITYTSKIVSQIHDIAMSLRLVTIDPLFQKLQRAGRDAAEALHKNVKFEISGNHIEIDKIVLDKITDPLIHLVRNAVDHGVEDTAERKKYRKDPAGTITIVAMQKEDHIVIEISDDGSGLDKEKILAKAQAKNMVDKEKMLNEDEIFSFIFYPGFSTKDKITEISGRGVGLDILRSTLDELNGSIHVRSKKGIGTKFKMSLPVSLSIISGLLIMLGEHEYVIPLSQVTETIEFKNFNQQTLHGETSLINFRGEMIPILSLSKILNIETSQSSKNKNSSQYTPGIVTSYNGKKLSFSVDEIKSNEQIVLKKIGLELSAPGIMAGAILKNGEPSLVLDLHSLVV